MRLGPAVSMGVGSGFGFGVEPEQPAIIAASREKPANSTINPDFRISSNLLRRAVFPRFYLIEGYRATVITNEPESLLNSILWKEDRW